MAANVDRGPLTLHHDTPPRENQPFDPNIQLFPDVRFKGYPSQNFDSPRIPLTRPDPRNTQDSELNPLVHRGNAKVPPNSEPSAVPNLQLYTDARFKGYPSKDFESPRIPLTKKDLNFTEPKPVPVATHDYEQNFDPNIQLWPDARFKGYPAKDFESPRMPLTKRDITLELESERVPPGHFNSTTKQFTDVRFQGYPSQNFSTPRVPLAQQDPRDTYQIDRQLLSQSVLPGTLLFTPSYSQLYPDARFKGYPSQFFETPRIPRTKPSLENVDNNQSELVLQPVEAEPESNPVDEKVAPRDTKPVPTLKEADLFQDFRFKGYPNVGNDFVSPRIPLTKSVQPFNNPQPAAARPSSPKPPSDPPPPANNTDGPAQHNNMQHSNNNNKPDGPGGFYQDRPSSRPRRRIDEYYADEVSPRYTDKKIRERDEINQFLEQKKFEREMKEKERKMEQREAFKMLGEKNDYGKPGAGAPNNPSDHRKQKFTEQDLTSRHKTPPRYPDQFAPAFSKEEIYEYQKDQDTARNRVDSRNKETYRFPPNEKEIYAKQLETEVQNRALRDQGQKINEMQNNLDQIKHETGYRGPSPHRAGPVFYYCDGQLKTENRSRFRRKMYHSNDITELRNRVQARDSFAQRQAPPSPTKQNGTNRSDIKTDTFDPWGKGFGNPDRDILGNFRRYKPYSSIEPGFGDRVWEDFAPKRVGPATQYQDDYYNLGKPAGKRRPNWETSKIYHPFGRPGAGAPLKDVEGNIITGRRGQMSMMGIMKPLEVDYTREELRQKKRAADELHFELQKGAEEQRRNRELMDAHMKAPVGELAAVIQDGKVGKPMRDPVTGNIVGNPIPISDVSQMKMNKHPVKGDQKKAYHEYLTQQSEFNDRVRKLDRLKENQLSRKHHETMDNSWGRAGGGAPKGPHLQKFNLENSLYQWDNLAAPQEYIRSKDWSHITDDQQQKLYDQMISEQRGVSEPRPPIFARTTVPSTHANQYEYPEAGLKKNYVLDVPFATQFGRTSY